MLVDEGGRVSGGDGDDGGVLHTGHACKNMCMYNFGGEARFDQRSVSGCVDERDLTIGRFLPLRDKME